MADVQPFSALRYRPQQVPELARVVAPPYDVISPAEQAAYHARDARNVIRLELGQTFPEDSATDNRYTRARAALEEWLRDGVLGQDHRPAFYAYEQEFAHGGQRLVRRGFFASVRLRPWSDGVVLPHEKTLAKPKADRLELLRVLRTNVSPVFSLYHDASGAVASALEAVWSTEPLMLCSDDAGDEHRVWALDDEVRCGAITRALAAVPLYIADGHHRYETALAYYDQRCAEARGEPSAEAGRVLMVLVPSDDPGLLVLPTHRLIAGIAPERLGDLDGALARSFTVEDLPAGTAPDVMLARLRDAGQNGAAHRFVLAGPAGRLRLLSRHRDSGLSPDGEDVPSALRDLDVWQAQRLILEEALGLDSAGISGGDNLRYTRDAAEALAAVRGGTAQLALLLNATPATAVMRVADAGATMPQKSTYFYPKLITGLLMRELH